MSGRWWTTKEIRTLHDLYGKFSAAEIAEELSRTKAAVRSKTFELGLELTPEQASVISSRSNKAHPRGIIRQWMERREIA